MRVDNKGDWIELLATPLSAERASAFVADPTCGGIGLFLGTTRAERRASDGVELLALDYEAYADMAVAQLRDLAAAARARWPVVKIAILHRLGRVAPAEASVVVAVSTPHRDESFEACRFLIDALKKDVAIWKKEVWSDGGATWVHRTER